MSKIIYPGYKIDEVFTSYELSMFANEVIRPIIINSYKKLIKKTAIERMVRILDIYKNYEYLNKTIDKNIDMNKDLYSLSQDIFYEKKWFDLFNIQCSVYIYPLKDKTLFLLTNEKEEYTLDFSTIDEIKEYSYWDSDEPDDISEEEWQQRKQDWDEALKNTFYLKDLALIINVIDSFEFIVYDDFYKDFESFIPSDEIRLQNLNSYAKEKKLEIKDINLIKINKDIFNKNLNELCD